MERIESAGGLLGKFCNRILKYFYTHISLSDRNTVSLSGPPDSIHADTSFAARSRDLAPIAGALRSTAIRPRARAFLLFAYRGAFPRTLWAARNHYA